MTKVNTPMPAARRQVQPLVRARLLVNAALLVLRMGAVNPHIDVRRQSLDAWSLDSVFDCSGFPSTSL